MTRRDYVALAQALHNAKPDPNPERSTPCQNAAYMAWYASVCAVSAALTNDNARFDSDRFLEACEYGTRKVA